MDVTQPSPGLLRRFSSRLGSLDRVFLKDRLQGASRYDRIAGYFRSSIFELIFEEVSRIERVRVVCNCDLDVNDFNVASRALREANLKEAWNRGTDEVEAFLHQRQYQRLYELLKAGNVEIRVVPRDDAPFLHGKAGVIRYPDRPPTSFMGSANETLQAMARNYEIVWEDLSAEGAAWVQAEFDWLWARAKPLPEAVVEEVGRTARKVQVAVADLKVDEVPAAALVEAPIYRRGEELKPWQQAFMGMALEHRRIYGQARFVLADEVGVGKTLSLAGAAMVNCLLGDGPALILCPATLCEQWQTELKDKLGIPSAVWLSARKVWKDDAGRLIRTRGPEDIARCPYQIGIVSTGLIVHDTPERAALASRRFGTLILDEAHKARKSRGLTTDEPKANNLLAFMMEAARNARHVILGTATPIQTHVEELWDLMQVLNAGADHVLGRFGSPWRRPETSLKVITGQAEVTDEAEAWSYLRSPLPPEREHYIFGDIRRDLNVRDDAFFTDRPAHELDRFTRDDIEQLLAFGDGGIPFFQKHNPFVRHVVRRTRQMLEDAGLMDRIAVDVFPTLDAFDGSFEGLGLLTSDAFDEAYRAARDYCKALAKRKKGTGFMESMLLQRICSSYASGLATAERMLKREQEETTAEAEGEDQQRLLAEADDMASDERLHLERMIYHLRRETAEDPKFGQVVRFLTDRGWLELGCIIFSQYYDTAAWIAQTLSARFPAELIGLYAGADKSRVLRSGRARAVEREDIKKAVKDREIRLVVATDAACEGLNLQTLSTLINVDLPWNPSRLEQRLGRIKRFGQARARVAMLNLVYHGTRDEKVYQALSKRMKDQYDIFGSLPDTIEDGWIDDQERLEEELDRFIVQKREANAFALRYEETIRNDGDRWELCEKVLRRRDLVNKLSEGW
jgi:superfamily II DNA or RNA helicase